MVKSRRWRCRRTGGWRPVGGNDATVRLWDAAAGTERAGLQGHGDWVRAVALKVDDGRLAASPGNDTTVQLGDTAARAPNAAGLQGHSEFGAAGGAGRADGAPAASGGLDGTARLWDTATGTERLPGSKATAVGSGR